MTDENYFRKYLNDPLVISGNTPPIIGAIMFGVYADVPVGDIDDTNRVFILSQAPNPAVSLFLYKNGVFMTQDIDYVLVGSTITYSVANTPMSSGDSPDTHIAFYQV